jgi:hypothetical protein
MRWSALLTNPTLVNLSLLVVSVVWMLKNERDKSRPLVVMALVLNLFYGWALGAALGKEDSLLPWKYDYYLHRIDGALGVSAASVTLALRGSWVIALNVIYQLMVPMMIFWCALSGRYKDTSVALAYVAEMVIGPLLYAMVPACGPLYAFGATWLQPPTVEAQAIRFSGFPNAFPSLHFATALLFVLSARRRIWRGVSIAFLLGTALGTLTTGEHYVIDLVAGAAFGCFAYSAGNGRMRRAAFYLAIVLCWGFAIRFSGQALIFHPAFTKAAAGLTVALAVHAVIQQWRSGSTAGVEEPLSVERHPAKEVPVVV